MSSSSTSSVEEAVDGAVDVAAPTPEANTTECSARPMDTAQAALSSGHPQKPAQEKIFAKPADEQQHDESAEQLRAEIRASVAASPEMARKQAANLFKETPPSLENITEERSSELASLRSSSSAAAADTTFAREEDSSAFGGGRGEFVGGGGAEERGRLSVSSAPSHRDSAGGESDCKFAKLHEALVDALKEKEDARAELAKATADAHTLRLQLVEERDVGDAWKSEAERLFDKLQSERAEKNKALAQLRQAGRKFEQLRAELADKTRRGDRPPDGDDDDKEAADKSLIIDSEKSISGDDMRAGVNQSAESVASERAAREAELRLECRRLEKRAAVDVLGDEPLAKRPCHRAPVTEALFDALVVEPPPTVTSVFEAFGSDPRQILGLGPRDGEWKEEWSMLDEWPLLASPRTTDAQKLFGRKVHKSGMERANLPRFFGNGAVDLSKPTHKRDVGWQCPICRDRRRFATLPALKTHMTKQHKGECCTRCFAKHPVGKRTKRDLKRHGLVCDGDTCPCGWQDPRPGGKSLGLLDHFLNAHG